MTEEASWCPVLQSLQPGPASDGAPAGSREAATVVFGASISKVMNVPPPKLTWGQRAGIENENT